MNLRLHCLQYVFYLYLFHTHSIFISTNVRKTWTARQLFPYNGMCFPIRPCPPRCSWAKYGNDRNTYGSSNMHGPGFNGYYHLLETYKVKQLLKSCLSG